MPKIDKYWVFHEGQLFDALEAHIKARIAEGEFEDSARAEASLIREFLTSDAGKPLQGGRGE